MTISTDFLQSLDWPMIIRYATGVLVIVNIVVLLYGFIAKDDDRSIHAHNDGHSDVSQLVSLAQQILSESREEARRTQDEYSRMCESMLKMTFKDYSEKVAQLSKYESKLEATLKQKDELENGLKSVSARLELLQGRVTGMAETEKQLNRIMLSAMDCREIVDRASRQARDCSQLVVDLEPLCRKMRSADRELERIKDKAEKCHSMVEETLKEARKGGSAARKIESVCSFYDMLDRDGFWKPIEEFEGTRNRR